ncbi:MAG TPA: proton-conducting transporter membrane subunit, partial [Anaerovoracaceae bacterium]|nr:proton-conducting transporter membrane subunit [Anaerovoracaceae bacterium]
FCRYHRLCTLFAQGGCILASLLGIVFTLTKLLSGNETLVLEPFRSAIPFLSITIAIDALSAFFLLILSVLVCCVSIYSIGYISHYHGKRNVSAFHVLYIAFILSMIFVFTAGNAVFFFMAWEIMAVISYFLVVFESEQEGNEKAGLIYIVMTHIGTAYLMIAFMIMFSYTKSFDIFGSSEAIPAAAKNLMFVFFLIGFGVKAGVVPVHIWLPYAHPAAPSNVSALMSGIMIKTAIYGLIRFVLCYLGIQHSWWGVAILCVGIVSAVLGVAYALMEHNIKRLLAFHSVENIGIILIGLGISFTAFSGGNELLGGLALAASLLHTFNHTLFKGGLFLGAGSIQYAAHTKDIEKLGGLIKKMPVTAVMVLCFSLSISAIVPFNGFVSEWLTYQSLFSVIIPGQTGLNILSILSVAALAMSGALAAACFVKLFGISFLGKPRSESSLNATETPVSMNAGMGILAAFCLAIGLFPMPFLKVIDKVVSGISGTSVTDGLQGGFLIVYYPVRVSGNTISPVEMLIALAIIILVAAAVIRLAGGKAAERKYGTWDCGFPELTPRMQYTATGFTKPLRIVLRILYRPGRSLEIEEGDSAYFPHSRKYNVWTEPIFEKYVYDPLLHVFKKLSLKIKLSVQTGSTHAYLVYMFIAVLALMLYNRLA